MVNLDRLKNAVLQAMAYNAIDTNKEFASVLGYTESYFSQVLTGRQPCNSKFIQRLKDKLPNLDVEDLYNQDAICVNMPASAPIFQRTKAHINYLLHSVLSLFLAKIIKCLKSAF